MLTLIPAEQRRTLPELVDRLDLRSGERASKTSAFWIMLTLSGVIAVSGIAADSTATVIGAMIVAPLSTPILGIGLGIVTGRGRLILSSLGYVAAGLVLVTLLGIVVSQLLPNPTNVLANSQVLGRTSPTLVDLLAAIATGLAGAVAITRRDVGDVLPGVAIAISLVPPLGRRRRVHRVRRTVSGPRRVRPVRVERRRDDHHRHRGPDHRRVCP